MTEEEIKKAIAESLSRYSLAMTYGSGQEQSDAIEKLSETLAKLIAENKTPE